MQATQLPSRFSIAHHGRARGPAYESWREDICRGFCRLDVGPAGWAARVVTDVLTVVPVDASGAPCAAGLGPSNQLVNATIVTTTSTGSAYARQPNVVT